MIEFWCLIIFEEKAKIQDQQPLSLNRDRDRLRKYWADMCLIIFEDKAEKQDQYPLSLNPAQKADDPESGL